MTEADDLKGNIALDNESDPQSAGLEEAKNGFQPENRANHPNLNPDDLNTLDEPVLDTIVSQLFAHGTPVNFSSNSEARSDEGLGEAENRNEPIL